MKMKTMVTIGVVAAIVLGIVAAVVSVSVTSGSGGASTEDLSAIGPFKAVVVLNVAKNDSDPNKVTGILELSQESPTAPVRIQGTIKNLNPGKSHGFHVHESGDIRNGCASTGGHFNPYTKSHGAPSDTERHVGDLGNIEVASDGTSAVDITDDKLSLAAGPNCIVGRAIVVHEGMDDLGKGGNQGSLTTGNAGGRAACGIIGVIFQKN